MEKIKLRKIQDSPELHEIILGREHMGSVWTGRHYDPDNTEYLNIRIDPRTYEIMDIHNDIELGYIVIHMKKKKASK